MAKTTRSVKGQDKLERTQKRGAKRLKGFIAWQAEAKVGRELERPSTLWT